MEEPAVGYAGSKWDGAVSALSSVVTSLSSEVDFGLMLYPDGDARAVRFDTGGCGDLELGPSKDDLREEGRLVQAAGCVAGFSWDQAARVVQRLIEDAVAALPPVEAGMPSCGDDGTDGAPDCGRSP